MVVIVYSMRVRIRTSSAALEVFAADQTAIYIDIGERHRAYFFKVKVEDRSVDLGRSIRVQFVQAEPRVVRAIPCRDTGQKHVSILTARLPSICHRAAPRLHLRQTLRRLQQRVYPLPQPRPPREAASLAFLPSLPTRRDSAAEQSSSRQAIDCIVYVLRFECCAVRTTRCAALLANRNGHWQSPSVY